MRYVTIEVFCIACGEKIDSPSQCNMELFRLNMPTHHQCLLVALNFIKELERFGPIESQAIEHDFRPVRPVVEGVTVISAEGTSTGSLMSDDSIRMD